MTLWNVIGVCARTCPRIFFFINHDYIGFMFLQNFLPSTFMITKLHGFITISTAQ